MRSFISLNGEKKLASIATILSMTPDIILMDDGTIVADGSPDDILRNGEY